MEHQTLAPCYTVPLAELQRQWATKSASHTSFNLKMDQALRQATSSAKEPLVESNGQANEQMVEALMK